MQQNLVFLHVGIQATDFFKIKLDDNVVSYFVRVRRQLKLRVKIVESLVVRLLLDVRLLHGPEK